MARVSPDTVILWARGSVHGRDRCSVEEAKGFGPGLAGEAEPPRLLL